MNRSAAPVQGEMNQYVIDVAHRLRAAGEDVALVHAREARAEFQGTRYVFNHLDEMNADPPEVKVRLEAIIDDFQPEEIQIHGAANTAIDAWCAAMAPTVRFVHNHRYYCSGPHMTWASPRKMCDKPHGRRCLIRHYRRGCGQLNPLANAMHFKFVTQSLRDLRRAEHLQVASRSMRENLMRNGFDPRRIEVMPLYAPEPLEPRTHTRASRRMILHPGGLVPNKGVWLMVKGILELPEDVDLVLAGSGSLEAELLDYVKRRGLSQRIRIMGELEPAQWSRIYQQADLVVIPSMWNEPLGVAGIHAMAHGKPVVAFQSAGINEWLQNGVTGYAVPFGDRKAFLRRTAEVLSEPAQLLTMGESGRKAWEASFRPVQHVERLRAFYRKIARAP